MKTSIEAYPDAFQAARTIHEQFPSPFPLNVSRLFACMDAYRIFNLSSSMFNSIHAQNRAAMLYPKRAWTIYSEDLDTYLIVWNKNMDPASIRYSVAHEFGHILLNHERDWPTDRTLNKRHKENEANAFARHLLAPLNVIHELFGARPYNARLVSSYFSIPHPVAVNIHKDYSYWLMNRYGSCKEKPCGC